MGPDRLAGAASAGLADESQHRRSRTYGVCDDEAPARREGTARVRPPPPARVTVQVGQHQ